MRIKRWTYLRTLIQLKLFFSIYKNSIFDLCPNVGQFLKKVLYWRIRHLRKIILYGQGFWGGSDEKTKRMWLGLEIVVAALPPFIESIVCSNQFSPDKINIQWFVLLCQQSLSKLCKTKYLCNWANRHTSVILV